MLTVSSFAAMSLPIYFTNEDANLSALADTPSSQSVNQLKPASYQQVDQIMQAGVGHVFPGVAVTVIHDGEVVLNQAWGCLEPQKTTLLTQPDSLFDLASITKIFTTSTLLALLHARMLEFNTPLVELIPEFGESGPRPVDGGLDPHSKQPLPVPDGLRGLTVDPRQVTLWHLLTHTSGLAPWRDVYNAAGPVPAPPDEPEPVSRYTRWDNALRALCHYPFVDAPGDVVRYSDLGLLLLGEVVRRLSGMELDEAIAAYVLEPLKLASPVFNPVRAGRSRDTIHPTEDDPMWRKRWVWGEVHDENACGVGGVAGHAGLFSTARDVAALGQAWLDRDARLNIALETMTLATQEHASTGDMRRGLGWQIRAWEGANAGDRMSVHTYGHTGFTGNSLWIDPQRRLVVATLTNAVYYGRAFNGLYEFRRAIHDTLVEQLSPSTP